VKADCIWISRMTRTESAIYISKILLNSHSCNNCDIFIKTNNCRWDEDTDILVVSQQMRTRNLAIANRSRTCIIWGKNTTPVSYSCLARTDPYTLPCETPYLQKAQLLQRGLATFHVTENFAKLLKVMLNYINV